MVSKKMRLNNGTQVLFAPLHETKAVTVLILFPVGSRYEERHLNGASHFLEHLFFKGTKNRPSTLEISKELDGVGAEYNAFTGKDHTGYYVKVSADKLDLALDILSDMLYRSLFDPKEVERERGVIVEEINMYEDNPMMHLDEIFEQLLFKGNTLGRTIAGPRSIIRNVQREDLMGYKSRHYTPHNLLLTIAGRFNPKRATALVRKYFGAMKGAKRSAKFARFKTTQHRPTVDVRFRDTEQVQLGLGFPAYHYEHPLLPALALLSTILGGNMSSRLFITVRERFGLAYFIRTELSVYQDTGGFLVRAGLERRRLQEAIKKIWQELLHVRSADVSDEELNRAKEYQKGKIILGLEDSEAIADWVGKQHLLRGFVETPEERIAKLERVTKHDLRHVAKDIVKKEHLNLALIGPYRGAAPFRHLVRSLT